MGDQGCRATRCGGSAPATTEGEVMEREAMDMVRTTDHTTPFSLPWIPYFLLRRGRGPAVPGYWQFSVSCVGGRLPRKGGVCVSIGQGPKVD
ncbi:hypothetical protein IEO21_09756 [Rhodonia placenta]|uniref:Uncharacterized protein n=1 Tax=Rhodonia placenta TaxID=104341 RepID=A0A8H7TXY8_9APHY|nr:hypothetical protein IEO21_09756 [Postia placenta]